jgi:protein-histidine pros-kinase
MEATGELPLGKAGELPIVALTAKVVHGDHQMCLDAGMTDYVTKPIHRPELLATIHDLLSHLPLVPAAVTRDPIDPRDQSMCDAGCATLDIDQLLDSCSNDWELATEFLQKFVKKSIQDVAELSRANASGDFGKLAGCAHALRGAASSLGAARVAQAAADLEDAARYDVQEDLPDLLARIEYEVQECQRAIAEYLGLPASADQPFPVDQYENLDCRR